MVRRLVPLLALIAASLLDAAVPSAGHDLFVIERNKNRNLVQYQVRLDEGCTPVGDEPLGCFWRMIEQGPEVTEEVGVFERRAYGVADQECRADGVIVHLRAVPERPVTVRTTRDGGACRAEAYTRINGAEARLTRIYVMADEAALLPSVKHIDLFGVAPEGRAVTERLTSP
jgi:hypothetical protein